jgi:hypothetical protein
MPIEDVNYLLRNSQKESALFFIDSTKRNRQFYPTPAEYVIDLEEPVRNVFGIDILDATIPNSMYNVDVHNNVMRLVTIDDGSGTCSYDDFSAEITEMSFNPIFASMINTTTKDHKIVVVSNDPVSYARILSEYLDTSVTLFDVHLPASIVFVRMSFVGVPMIPISSQANNVSVFDVGGKTYEIVEPQLNRAFVAWLGAANSAQYSVRESSLHYSNSKFYGVSPDIPMYDVVHFACVPVTSVQAVTSDPVIQPHVRYVANLYHVTIKTGN